MIGLAVIMLGHHANFDWLKSNNPTHDMRMYVHFILQIVELSGCIATGRDWAHVACLCVPLLSFLFGQINSLLRVLNKG